MFLLTKRYCGQKLAVNLLDSTQIRYTVVPCNVCSCHLVSARCTACAVWSISSKFWNHHVSQVTFNVGHRVRLKNMVVNVVNIYGDTVSLSTTDET